MASKPSRWPPHLQYISASRFHQSVPTAARLEIQGSNNHPTSYSQSTRHSNRSIVIIRLIFSTSHPAYGQYGLFAAKKIPPKTHIIDYIGRLTPKVDLGYLNTDSVYQARYTVTIDQSRIMTFHFTAPRMAFTWA
jgi:hypothetical protein